MTESLASSEVPFTSPSYRVASQKLINMKFWRASGFEFAFASNFTLISKTHGRSKGLRKITGNGLFKTGFSFLKKSGRRISKSNSKVSFCSKRYFLKEFRRGQ